MANLDYSRVARVYRWLEFAVFSSTLQQVRTSYLDVIIEHIGRLESPFIAVVGDGDGRFLEALLQSDLKFRVDYVDRSLGMLALAKKRVGSDPRVSWFCEDFSEREWVGYDVVVCHFVFSSFEFAGRERFAQGVVGASKPGGLLLVSDFDSKAHFGAAALVWCMQCFFYLFAGVPRGKVTRLNCLLRGLGMTKMREKCWWKGTIFSQIWKM